MSITTLIIGRSGSGKTASMRNLPRKGTYLIQVLAKRMPFRRAEAEKIASVVTDNWQTIVQRAQWAAKNGAKVIVVDDFQYLMANEFMRRTTETGFQKFTEIGYHAWDVLNALIALPDDVRVYVLSHSEEADDGRIKMKTIGKMLDEKITLEGMVTTVLRTTVNDGQHYFATRNNGNDTVKAPIGLFEDDFIDNDLAAVDELIQSYYEINQQPAA